MFRPCIVLRWLGKVVQEFHNEHLNDVCINPIILGVVLNYCPHFNNNFEPWSEFGNLSLISGWAVINPIPDYGLQV